MLNEVVGMSKTCKLHSFLMTCNTHKGLLLFNLNHKLQKDFLVTSFLAGYEERNTICMGKNACQIPCKEDVKKKNEDYKVMSYRYKSYSYLKKWI